ncbi:hypothetical protein Ancab_024669 [Ancistrocladus abbreviatus]
MLNAFKALSTEIPEMASITMTASFLGASTSTVRAHRSATARRGIVMAKATPMAKSDENNVNRMEEGSSKRRDLVFAAAAAAVCSVAKVAMAEEPKRGTLEAKKKYNPVMRFRAMNMLEWVNRGWPFCCLAGSNGLGMTCCHDLQMQRPASTLQMGA